MSIAGDYNVKVGGNYTMSVAGNRTNRRRRHNNR